MKLVVPDITAGEEELLRLVLREMRHAVASKQQLQVIFDPHLPRGLEGRASLHFGYSARGFCAEAEGVRSRRSKRPAR